MGNNETEAIEKEFTEASAEAEAEAVVETEADEKAEAEAAAGSETEVSEESAAEVSEEAVTEAEAEPKKKINIKKLLTISGICAAALALIYIGGVVYYSGHFFWGTEIGNFDCSNMTVIQAQKSIQSEIDGYSFTFYEKDDKQETIKGEEIKLQCSPVQDLSGFQKKQNAFTWFLNRGERQFPLDVEVSFDKDALYNRITEMDFMAETRKNMEGSVDKIYYEDGQYYVRDDGTKDIVSVNSVYQAVKPKILGLYKGMSLEKEDYYTGLAGDDTMKGVLNMLNKYVGTRVTYTRGEEKTVLDCNTIHDWLTVDENYLIRIDAQKAREYVNELAKGYDTVGKERVFKTTGGSEVTVRGGSYGWLMDNQKETQALLDNIRNGETVEREPVYKRKAAAHNATDIANTYVEVSIGAQHVWFYKDGNLVVSTDCVTGNTANGHGTHTGTYYVAFKQRNAILRGQDYETPVNFWMPFNAGEGLHDANWRGAFGGSIYRGGGSHGCVNLPYNAAAAIFQSISAGDPVVIY